MKDKNQESVLVDMHNFMEGTPAYTGSDYPFGQILKRPRDTVPEPFSRCLSLIRGVYTACPAVKPFRFFIIDASVLG